MKKENDTQKFIIVDNETGEVVKELKAGDRIISKKQAESYNNRTGTDKRHFSFGKMKKMKEIAEKLDAKKCGYIVKLLPFMQYGTGYLLKEDGSVMKTKTDLGNGIGVKKVASRNKIIDTLMEVSAIEVDEIGYKVNPDIHIRNVVTGNELIKLFKTTLEKLSNDLKPAELGYLYKLLPYVHYQTNLICSDPFEENPEILFFLNQTSLGELLGLEHKEIKNFITKLRKKGVIAEALNESDTRNKKYYVNPYIFYRKKGYPDDTLRSMFKSSPYNSNKNTR